MNHEGLSAEAVAFIRAQSFLIVATANAAGDSDCSYRGRQPRGDGTFEPLVEVLDPGTLVLPDFAGNNLFNTLGNLLVNPGIALLFVDFPRKTAWMVQGRATIDEDPDRWASIWPEARRYVVVAVDDAHAFTDAELPALVLA